MSPSQGKSAHPPGKAGGFVVFLVTCLTLAAVGACWWYLFMKEATLPPSPTNATGGVKPLPSVASTTKHGVESVSSGDTTEVAEATDAADSSETEEAAAKEVVDPVEAQWDALAVAITDAVLNQAFTEAVALNTAALSVSQPDPIKTRLKELEAVLGELPEMDHLIVAGLTRAIGQEILLSQNEKTRRLIIRAVSAKTLSAVKVTQTGTVDEKNTVTIKVSSLSPKDKLKWIGDASTPSRAMMKYLLHRQAGNVEQATDYAGKCGPISAQLLARVAIDGGESDEEASSSAEDSPQ